MGAAEDKLRRAELLECELSFRCSLPKFFSRGLLRLTQPIHTEWLGEIAGYSLVAQASERFGKHSVFSFLVLIVVERQKASN